MPANLVDEKRSPVLTASNAGGPATRSVEPGPALAVIVPTFNERKNIDELVGRLYNCLRDIEWEVVFVDDNSPDGTADHVRTISQQDRRVRCLHRIGRRGLSSACIEGMLATSAPFVAVMDGDLQHDERVLPRMLALLQAGEAEIVMGSRYVEGGGIGNWAESRAVASRLATRLSRIVLRARLTDPMTGFFMMRREVLRECVTRLSGIGFKILLDIFASSPRPLVSRELPYTFRQRLAGESKFDTMAIWEYVMLLLDKLVGHIVPVRFVTFAFVGGLGVLVHLTVLAALFRGLQVSFVHAQAVATFTAMTFNYAINNVLTYRDMQLRGWAWLGGWVSFTIACSIGALANVGIAVYLFQADTLWILAALAGILVGAVWNYAVTMVYTWRKPSRG